MMNQEVSIMAIVTLDLKTTMLKSSLSVYSEAYILVKGRITIAGDVGPEPNPDLTRTEAQLLAARQSDEKNKEVIFKNCASFTRCISKINNTQVDNAKNLDFVTLMYNMIEYSDNYNYLISLIRGCII